MRNSNLRVKGFWAAAATAAMLALTPAAFGQVYDGASFVGLPVLASDGVEVGEVVSEDMGEDGTPSAIRVAVGQTLGLGEKIIELSRDQYVGLQGAVTLEAASGQVQEFPAAAE